MFFAIVLGVVVYFMLYTWSQIDNMEKRCLSYDEQIRFFAKEIAALKDANKQTAKEITN